MLLIRAAPQVQPDRPPSAPLPELSNSGSDYQPILPQLLDVTLALDQSEHSSSTPKHDQMVSWIKLAQLLYKQSWPIPSLSQAPLIFSQLPSDILLKLTSTLFHPANSPSLPNLVKVAKLSYWSSYVRPLVLAIFNYLLPHNSSFHQNSVSLLDQLDVVFHKYFATIRSPLSPKPFQISAAPILRRKRRIISRSRSSARLDSSDVIQHYFKQPRLHCSAPSSPTITRRSTGFKCSGLVDPTDVSIQHYHQVDPAHRRSSSARSTSRRLSLFIGNSTRSSSFEVEQVSQLAQQNMDRALNCYAEDALDGDQRHRRFYLVNSYRAKNSMLSSTPTPTSSVWDCDDDEEELEPLEDLLDWDSTTR